MTIVGYFMVFVLAFVGIVVAVDAYLCQTQSKVNGVMRTADIKLSSSGDVDLTLRMRTNAWFQSRLHTVTMDAVNCALHIDTPSGRRLELSDASLAQSEPIVLKPKSLWAPLAGKNTFGGYDALEYSVEGTVAFARVNFAALCELLVDVLVEPWTGTHKLGADCVIDGTLMLFSVPSLAVPMKQYKVGADREFNLTHPTTTSSSTESWSTASGGKRALAATNELQRRALNTVSDVASRLKDFLSSLPALGPSLGKLSDADFEQLVNNVASNPVNVLYYLLYPILGADITIGEISKTYNVAKWDFGYTLKLPQDYIPDFLVNVEVPPLAFRVSSGTPKTTYSWLLSTKQFNLNLADSISVPTTVSCGNLGKNCTLVTPVFDFAYNIVNNRRDTWMFDMIGEDNFLYRAVGRSNSIAYTLDLNYDSPAVNVINALSVCVNVTVSNRWQLRNACVTKPLLTPGLGEVDVSFDIPSADGTPGTYLGMSSAFKWVYTTVKPPTKSPTFIPTEFPTQAPTKSPTFGPTPPAGSPTLAPSTATPSISLATINTISPTIRDPTKVSRNWTVIVEQDVRGLNQASAIGSYDFAQTFLYSLKSLKDSTTFPIPRSVTFQLVSVTYGLSCEHYWCNGDYVTRVAYMASVTGGESMLPLVGDHLAALVYNGELQVLLRLAYPSATVTQYGSIRLQLGSSQPSGK